MTTRFREHTTTATWHAFNAICFAGLVIAISGCLYAAGWINADVFVAVLWVTIAHATSIGQPDPSTSRCGCWCALPKGGAR